MTTDTTHPTVNADNYRVEQMPAQFTEGDCIARKDTWSGEESSNWVVDDVWESDLDADAGFKYLIRRIDGDTDEQMTVSHGELQMLAARNALDWV